MKKLLFLSLLASAMLFAACSDSNEEATPEENEVTTQDKDVSSNGQYIEGSIINCFYEPDTLNVSFWSPTQGYEDTRFCLYLARTDGNLNFKGNYWNAYSEKGQEYVKYYGDTTFSGWFDYSSESYKVSAMPLNSINVTANKDFDSEHPAGSSLNEIFTLGYASAYNLIQSGYDANLNINWDPYNKKGTADYEQVKLSEFKPLNLLFYESHLTFNKLPEKLGTYEFTITFNYGKDPINGREAKVAPAVVKAEFTEKDYVTLPKDKK